MMRESWLPSAPESAPTARDLVRAAATEHGFDGDATWDLMLATSEAIANAVLHGRPCERDPGGIRLRVEGENGFLRVEVCDCGRFEPEPAPRALDATGGRGMPIIAAVMDEFEVVGERSGTRVRFGKRRVAERAIQAGASSNHTRVP
jgi:anti-sigma regulatory factor (Ser/Thr protein kinase)